VWFKRQHITNINKNEIDNVKDTASRLSIKKWALCGFVLKGISPKRTSKQLEQPMHKIEISLLLKSQIIYVELEKMIYLQ